MGMKYEGTCIVSWSFSDEDTGILIVGVKKPNETIEVINAFQGKEAKELFEKLTQK